MQRRNLEEGVQYPLVNKRRQKLQLNVIELKPLYSVVPLNSLILYQSIHPQFVSYKMKKTSSRQIKYKLYSEAATESYKVTDLL